MKIAAETTEQIRERERTARRQKEKQHNQDFATSQKREDFAIELSEALAGETAVWAGSRNNREDRGGKKNDHPDQSRSKNDGEMANKLAANHGCNPDAGNQGDVDPLTEDVFVLSAVMFENQPPIAELDKMAAAIETTHGDFQQDKMMQTEDTGGR